MTRNIAEMTDVQYERYLKRNGLTGMAAAAMDRKRREAQKLLSMTPAEPRAPDHEVTAVPTYPDRSNDNALD